MVVACRIKSPQTLPGRMRRKKSRPNKVIAVTHSAYMHKEKGLLSSSNLPPTDVRLHLSMGKQSKADLKSIWFTQVDSRDKACHSVKEHATGSQD